MDTMKTLRVCLSEDLPLLADRDPQYIYFLYDKLLVFLGQSIYNDPYAIVQEMPENPVHGMLYFCLDGFVRVYIEYEIKDIAEIETPEQLEILKQAGTTFFVHADKRYLDLKRRIVTLPYKNGTYELTVSVANNLLLDKDTVIAFNPETNEFDISGKREDYDLVFTRKYRGKDTETASVDVSEHRISADIKISPAYGNMIKIVNDGLYAYADGKMTKEEFESWKSQFREYKLFIETYLGDLMEQIENAQDIVSEEAISKRIHKSLVDVYPEIDEALTHFNEYAAQFNGIETRCKEYSDDKFSDTYDSLSSMIYSATDNPWGTFEAPKSETVPDPDEDDTTNQGDKSV